MSGELSGNIHVIQCTTFIPCTSSLFLWLERPLRRSLPQSPAPILRRLLVSYTFVTPSIVSLHRPPPTLGSRGLDCPSAQPSSDPLVLIKTTPLSPSPPHSPPTLSPIRTNRLRLSVYTSQGEWNEHSCPSAPQSVGQSNWDPSE